MSKIVIEIVLDELIPVFIIKAIHHSVQMEMAKMEKRSPYIKRVVSRVEPKSLNKKKK